MKLIVIGLLAVMTVRAQTPNALLASAEATQLSKRVVQLMESTADALPELQLASAPLLAGANNTLKALQQQPLNAGLTETLTRQTRAFLAIADATQKPANFPDTARKQFSELRENFERLELHFSALVADKEAQTRSPDRDELKRYAEANSRVLPPGANARVVFLGDSITDNWHLNEYFTGRDFINRGIAGQVTGQMLGRFKADVIDLRPRAVLILGGINDISRGTPLNIIESNLVTMAELARLHQIKVIFASVLPAGHQQTALPRETIQQLNSWTQNYCIQSGSTYVDYYATMRDPAGYLQTDLADDGLHPNSKGYRIMAPLALTAIDHALGTSSAPQEPVRKRRVRVF